MITLTAEDAVRILSGALDRAEKEWWLRQTNHSWTRTCGLWLGSTWMPYPSEVEDCCKALKPPPRFRSDKATFTDAQYYAAQKAFFKHCKSIKHIAHKFGVPRVLLLRRVRAKKEALYAQAGVLRTGTDGEIF